jgi:CubicO group peptidase (beta-lactamase class C family)
MVLRQHQLRAGGLLVEKAAGRSMERYVTEQVIRPAGLRHTYFPGRFPVILGPHAKAYEDRTTWPGSLMSTAHGTQGRRSCRTPGRAGTVRDGRLMPGRRVA